MTHTDRTPSRTDGGASALLGPRLAALVVIAVGALVFYESLQIRSPAGFSPVGPRFVPLVVAIGLAALGAAFLFRTTLQPDTDLAERCEEQERATFWPTVGLVAATLVVYAFALGVLGYLVATAILVPVAARILGSDRPIRDVIVGIGLAGVVYVGFTELLGVRLPAGVLDFVL